MSADKPSRYFVEYVTKWVEDEAPVTELVDVPSLSVARRVYVKHKDALPQIRERLNIRDATPADEPIRGLIWDFEEELIEDAP